MSRHYGIKVGDYVIERLPTGQDGIHGRVVAVSGTDNNRVYIDTGDGKPTAVVAEWCRKVPDPAPRPARPSFTTRGCDCNGCKMSKSIELHIDAIEDDRIVKAHVAACILEQKLAGMPEPIGTLHSGDDRGMLGRAVLEAAAKCLFNRLLCAGFQPQHIAAMLGDVQMAQSQADNPAPAESVPASKLN